jgi:hypothetical protein
MKDGYLTFPTAGNVKTHMTVGAGIHGCGQITDGVSISNHNEGGWAAAYVMEFKDLEAWYLAAVAWRETVRAREQVTVRTEP